MLAFTVACALLSAADAAPPPAAQFPAWRFKKGRDPARARDIAGDGDWPEVTLGHTWKSDKEPAWLRTAVVIPETIDGAATAGAPVGLRFSAGELAEIHVAGELQQRGDNDHPGTALLSASARPGDAIPIAVRVWPGSGGEQEVKLNEAALCLIEPRRARERFPVRVACARTTGPLPRPFAGLSQGGGMADYLPATAAKLKEIGVRWFRMDNVLTNALKAGPDGTLVHDWTDLDRRLDFIRACGAEPIMCLSYMPQVLDAVPNNDRHSVPRDYALWESLCHEAAKHAIERGTRVPYWEVWNETNSGWLDPGPGADRLDAYLKLYAASARGVRKADPNAWVGGPCNASGPWDRSPERGYCVDGEKFMRGLLDRCERDGLPLDFISWHEYFQPPWIFTEEVLATRAYLKDYPKAAAGVKEFFITEWNYAWWPDPAHDCELGAAWCADTVMRVFIPLGVQKPCFFYVKDGDDDFRGSYAMLMGPENRPKPAYNVMKQFAMLAPERLACEAAEDGELTAIASTDPATGRVTALVVNYAQRYGVPRPVEVAFADLPAAVRGGELRVYTVDAAHSNAWHDRAKAELECVATRPVGGGASVSYAFTALPASVTLIEIAAARTIGSRLEPFADRHLIDSLDGAELRLCTPVPRETVLLFDKPWEGRYCGYATVIKDGDLYQLYYRGLPLAGKDGSANEVTCYAESRDGIAWTKPALGLFEAAGTCDNNVILAGDPPFSHNFAPLLDARPGCPEGERFKALAGVSSSGLWAFASADGIRWRKLGNGPVLAHKDFAFDSQNVAFWSAEEGCYVCYCRTWENGRRSISRATSADFLNWTALAPMGYGPTAPEHLYTNGTRPYFRAPHIAFALAARFMPGRRVVPADAAEKLGGEAAYSGDCSDAVFMTTRGGLRYDRTFMEGFLRPGPGLENWTSRTNYPAYGIVPTGEGEMSFYVQRRYGQLAHCLQRMSLRLDGAACVHAPYEGGAMTTAPLIFAGRELVLNAATSAAGSIRVEIQDAAGAPLPGRALADAVELVGDAIELVVRWKGGSDVATLAGTPVRLRFVMKDADLFALRFRP